MDAEHLGGPMRALRQMQGDRDRNHAASEQESGDFRPAGHAAKHT